MLDSYVYGMYTDEGSAEDLYEDMIQYLNEQDEEEA